jgi:hypothetical protein
MMIRPTLTSAHEEENKEIKFYCQASFSIKYDNLQFYTVFI